MRRRDFVALIGAVTAAASPQVALGQQTMPVIGFLNSGSSADWQRVERGRRCGGSGAVDLKGHPQRRAMISADRPAHAGPHRHARLF